MRIPCPFCGERELGEFTYLGDASLERPRLIADDGTEGPAARDAFYDYVYLRDNPAGDHQEYWYHGTGCRSWLVLVRSTLTHEIKSARPAPGAGGGATSEATS